MMTSAPSSEEPKPLIDTQAIIDTALIEQAFQQMVPGTLTYLSVGVVMFLGILFYEPSMLPMAKIWLSYLVFVSTCRCATFWAFKKYKTQHNLAEFKMLHIIGVTFAGLGWTWLGMFLLAPNISPLRLFQILLICGIGAGAVPALSPILLSALIYISLSMLPFSIYLFSLGDINILICYSVVLYWALMISMTIKNHQMLRKALGLQFENHYLVKNLTSTKFQLELTNEKLKQSATHDPLTSVGNRNLFTEHFVKAIERARINHNLLALIYIDLDNFKNVNDIYGHHTGDQLLTLMVKRMKRLFKDTDCISRLGGDEFSIIIENMADVGEIETLAQKLCLILAEPVQISDVTLHISGSIGISLFPLNSENPEDLLNLADRTMYAVKEQGGNNFRFGKEDTNTQI